MRARVLLFAVLVLGGCKSPREKHEAAARANLALLPSLFEAAATAPPVDDAATAALASVKDLTAKYQDSNALLIHLEELQNPTLRRALPLRLNHRSPTVDLAAALALTKPESGVELEPSYSPGLDVESNMTSAWQRLGALRYVLVVRARSQRDATLTGERGFIAGAWEGEVLVFEVPSKQLRGGFTLAGSNHASVKTAAGRDRENLAADLSLATRGTLNGRVRQLFPSVAPNDELN